jgi:hypothetical protein
MKTRHRVAGNGSETDRLGRFLFSGREFGLVQRRGFFSALWASENLNDSRL